MIQDGSSFGSDFLLYDGVPGEVHATWSVLVINAKDRLAQSTEDGTYSQPGPYNDTRGRARTSLGGPLNERDPKTVAAACACDDHVAAASRSARDGGKQLLLAVCM